MKAVKRIVIIVFSIISFSSCTNEPGRVEVPNGEFSYIPHQNWKFAFDAHDFEESYNIYTAVYEVSSQKTDSFIATLFVHAQHLDYINLECLSFNNYGDNQSSLQKAFQQKYGIKEPNLCKMIGENRRVFCDGDRTLDFHFQNEDVFIQCRMTIAVPRDIEREEEEQMLEEFDTFVRSFARL